VSLPHILRRDGESAGGTLGTLGQHTPPAHSHHGGILWLDVVVVLIAGRPCYAGLWIGREGQFRRDPQK